MEQLAKTSTPLFKKCSLCGGEKALEDFSKDKTSKDGHAYWCKSCRVKHQREYAHSVQGKEKCKIWRQSPKAKARRREYEHRPDRMELHRKRVHLYKLTDAGKATDKRWRDSEKGRLCRQQYFQVYSQTPTAIMNRFKRESSEGRKNWHRQYNEKHKGINNAFRMNRYYELQDEYGNHGTVCNWYPSYRVIKALETAPVVEISG